MIVRGSSLKLTPVPSAFIGIWFIKLDASKGGFAREGTVVGGDGVVIGNSEPSCEEDDRLWTIRFSRFDASA